MEKRVQLETQNSINEDSSFVNVLSLLDYSKRVLVVGDILLDKYVHGHSRKSSEYPVFTETSTEHRLGGAGNVANNLRAMGLCVDLLSVIGTDDVIVTDVFKENNIDTQSLISIDKYKVAIKTRYVSNWRQIFRADYGVNCSLSPKVEGQVIDKGTTLLSTFEYKVILFSDYNKGILTYRVVQEILSLAKTFQIPTVVDPYRLGGLEKFRGCTYIKPNLTNALNSYPSDLETDQEVRASCKKFCESLDANTCIMTLSERGIAGYTFDKITKSSTFYVEQVSKSVEVVDVIGAGDTVLAAIGFGICHKWSMEQIQRLANACAADIMKSRGTTVVDMLDIIHGCVLRTKEDLRKLKKLFPSKKTIVLTTGCFDILHRGHVDSLQEAKAAGDYLVVALNSDNSVKKNKGENRPINSLEERIDVLRSIKYVDFIVVFDDAVPFWIVEILDPDVFAKGPDYSEDQIREVFPSVRKFLATRRRFEQATSQIIEQIKKL